MIPAFLVIRIKLAANNILHETDIKAKPRPMQLTLFTDYDEVRRKKLEEKAQLEKERRQQEAVLSIKKRFGKNAILKGLNYADGATQKNRNSQIGGHHE